MLGICRSHILGKSFLSIDGEFLGHLLTRMNSYNRLDLPPYKSLDALQGKLTTAVEETMGFGLE